MNQIQVEVNWPYGKGLSTYAVSPYTQLYEVPEKPGVYIWLLRPRTQKDFILASELFEHATLSATVRGNIRINYSGELRKAIKHLELADDASSEMLFSDLFFAVGYPLYIGISQNLRTRLATHKVQFEEKLAARHHKEDGASTTPSNFGDDSDEESSYFGARLAAAWSGLTTDSLYIKYVIPRECRTCSLATCNQGCSGKYYNQLRAIEYSANSLFNPVFGRR